MSFLTFHHIHHYPDLKGVEARLANLEDSIIKLNEAIMAVHPKLQALLDALKPLTDGVGRLEAQIADLQSKISAADLSDDDKAAIDAAMGTVQATTAGITSALPQVQTATQQASA